MTESAGRVIAVIGASGGLGTSTLAAAVASAAAHRHEYTTLLDLDDQAGGIDVLLGLEEVAGPRWSGLRLAGGHLDPAALVAALPGWESVGVLSADVAPTPAVLAQTLEVARRAGPVVIDLPRWAADYAAEVLPGCDLLVLVTGSYVAQIAAARVLAARLDAVPTGLVVCRTGAARVEQVGAVVGLPLIGSLAAGLQRGRGDLALGTRRLPRLVRATARGVLDALDPPEPVEKVGVNRSSPGVDESAVTFGT